MGEIKFILIGTVGIVLVTIGLVTALPLLADMSIVPTDTSTAILGFRDAINDSWPIIGIIMLFGVIAGYFGKR